MTKDDILQKGELLTNIEHRGFGVLKGIIEGEFVYCTPTDGSGGVMTISIKQVKENDEKREAASIQS